jgi:hypothetical protein
VLTPENKLWRAVLQQAFDDAEQAASVELDFEPRWRSQARRYLRGDLPCEAAGLALVCDYADVPADRVISWARRRYPFAIGAEFIVGARFSASQHRDATEKQ